MGKLKFFKLVYTYIVSAFNRYYIDKLSLALNYKPYIIRVLDLTLYLILSLYTFVTLS
jgi:hypothetical protein